jgi:ATP diphosphatase
VDEIREVVTGGSIDRERAEEEMGDLLFAIANLSRKLGIEPETALRKANNKFTERFSEMERRINESGRTMHDMSLDQLEQEWERVKTQEPAG